MNPVVPQDVLEVLVFEVGGQHYGLPAASVREIVRAVTINSLPGAPAIIEGIINLRGTLVPVLDIRSRFRLPPQPLQPSDQFVVAWAGDPGGGQGGGKGRLVALRVDRALELTRLDAATVEHARGVVPGVEYVTWVAKRPHDLVLIHDLRTFLSRTEAVSLNDALSAQTPPEREG